MTRLGHLAVAQRRRTIVLWAAIVGILGLLGLGVEDDLHRTNVVVPGTGSAHAIKVTSDRFGERNTLIVVLRGPQRELDGQGTLLAKKLEADPELTVLSPFRGGGGDSIRGADVLRPKPGTAMLFVRSNKPYGDVARHTVPRVRTEVDRLTRAPVAASVSGFADLSEGIHNAIIESAQRAEMIAAPLLLVLLLFVFRSPIAAALPLVVGLSTIATGGGVLALLNRFMDIDAFAFTLTSVVGLALGVDYALVLVSRFREEIAAGHGNDRAVANTLQTAGRTIVYAGLTVSLAMVSTIFVAPANLLASASIGVLVAVALALLTSITVLPVALVILGPNVNRWHVGGDVLREGHLAGWAMRVIRRPVVALLVVAAVVVTLAAPALAMETGAPNPLNLPSDARERTDYDKVAQAAGGGWTAPYEITVVAPRGTITTRKSLRALAGWQREMARGKDVRAVLGPGALEKRTRGVDRVSERLTGADRALRTGIRGQRRLATGLGRARNGAQQLRGGLDEAGGGAQLLAGGGRLAADGSRRLAHGLGVAVSGGKLLRAGIKVARRGSDLLAHGTQLETDGLGQFTDGLGRAVDGLNQAPPIGALTNGLREGGRSLDRLREPAQIAKGELDKALENLDAMLPTSKADPQYRELYEHVARAQGAITGRNPRTGEQVEPGYDGLDSSLAQAAEAARQAADAIDQMASRLDKLKAGLASLEDGAGRLLAGSGRLAGGMLRLDDGLRRLDEGTSGLTGGLLQLAGGADRLAGGNGQLADGIQRLANGLTDGAERAGALVSGLMRMRTAVERATPAAGSLGPRGGTKRLAKTLTSGYFVLAALDTAPKQEREASSFAVNVDRAGTAGLLTVVPAGRNAQEVRDNRRLRSDLRSSLHDLEKRSGLRAYLGGPAEQLNDFDSAMSGRYPLLVLTLALLTFLVLVVMLRSLLMPLKAVLMNVLTIGAVFGVLTLLFQGDSAPLGGPGYLDAISIYLIIALAFGLSIDYEVFMLARMREGYALTGTTDGAVEYGIRRTAHIITGGALTMTGVFLATALSDVASIRMVGIGMAVAVILDSTLIRLVLLPAAMRLLGRANWWIPGWLDRMLPTPPHEQPDTFARAPERS
jgi:putative drug exporter of the RND superfamily